MDDRLCQAQVVLDVPKEGAGQIYFGVMLAGKGQVSLDAQGYLVTNSGLRVQGFTDSGLSTAGDLTSITPRAFSA